MQSVKRLKWWMIVVGAFYILLGIQNLPLLMGARFNMQYPTIELPLESVAVQALLDMWFMFGVEMFIVGFMLLIAARNPLQNKILVITVLVLELTRGIFIDAYWLTRDIYPQVIYVVFIAVHLVILVSGYVFLHQAKGVNVEADVLSSVPEELSSATPGNKFTSKVTTD